MVFPYVHRRTSCERVLTLFYTQISASMLEIYNDKVRDLGNPLSAVPGGSSSGSKSGGRAASEELRVRNHPDTGAYVSNLSVTPIETYADAWHLISAGLAVRTESATLMNHSSSRAHTIFSVTIKKTALRSAEGCCGRLRSSRVCGN